MEILRKILLPVLFPISLIYGLVVYIRNRLYDNHIFLKPAEFKIPLITIGNITVGGTGKTPHTEFLIDTLKTQFKIATLSRGYKRKSKGFVLASIESTTAEIGDEPRQIKQKFPEIIVAVDSNRARGISMLLEKYPDLDVILLDDAFQHRHVKANMSILLIDYSKPLYKDFILPFGNLREQSSEMRRANIIIITKTPKSLKPIDRRIVFTDLKAFPFQDVYFTTFDYGDLVPVFMNEIKNRSITESKDFSVLLVTGIANPKPLQDYLQSFLSEQVKLIKFPDHHQFNTSDIEQIKNKFDEINASKKIIITTEKDAMRLQNFSNIADNLKESWYYIPIKVVFQNNDTDEFNKKIIDYVRKNKTHSFLYTGKN
ncbi:MAG: tetraacyldisaccharide 4'-kinase [Bacteroidetes bacterium GWF2_33_16]|nr:MAG: tetraacyldisaccharide 4'-kinase [Bacteroidetes bacterium GWE2_32_14]OFY03687.1 MAG: tetraacyldisaccharide 4'-kinase [Bacteroidetes bacterium GWF2_33_16]